MTEAMRFGIKQKILLVLVGMLAFTIGLIALAASYYTDRQNEEAAFATLGNDLLAWRDDLQSSATQLRKAALAVVDDELTLTQLAETLTLELHASDPAKAREATEMARTLAYSKTVSLNRLYLMLRTGAFSSIAVYSGGKLSHYVSSAEVGMLVRWQSSDPVWIKASVDASGNLPFRSWPSWDPGELPSAVSPSMPQTRVPTVATVFPMAQAAAIEIAVPVEGVLQEFPPWLQGYPAEHVISDLAVGSPSKAPTNTSPGPRPRTLAVVVFRKLLDRAVLQGIASKTGEWPALFSPDGMHRQELTDSALISDELLRDARSEARDGVPHVVQRTVTTGHGSFYAAVLPWRFEGQPRLMLGFALSRDKTLHNIQQTVTAILILAGLILLLSVANGIYWVGRFIDPIVALTAAVKTIGLGNMRGLDGRSTVQLQPISLRAPDEIGDLARAFNTMIVELRQSFETLEQRVLARTAELRQQTRYLRTLLDTLPLWVCLKDANGRYLAANEPLARLCGLKSAEEMVGKFDSDIWPLKQAEMIRAEDAEVITTKLRKIVEEQPRDASADAPVWVERFRAPVLDEDGTVLGVVHVSRDISAYKTLEAARETALAEAVRLARGRSEFLARMSHELRTPLNAILGYAQIILQHRTQLTDVQARGIAIIQSSGEHLLALINDILDLARIDASKLELNPTDLDLGVFLRAVADLIQVKTQEKGLLFRYEAAGLPAVVRVDEKRLRQVLLNFLSNAVKFTDSGDICLRVQSLSIPTDGDPGSSAAWLRFQVQDSGIGMSEEQMARIFHPFEQVADTGRREGGAGLGLAISQQLVHLMGGEIRFESQLGRGSLFSFELHLPVVADEAVISPARRRAIGYEGPRLSILVVDDVAKNRAMLMDMLTPFGFEVLDACDGREALVKAERCRPDLIIMDVVMPVMDGLEATRQLRRVPNSAEIPVVAVSANATREEAVRSYDAGVDAFLAKPIEHDTLLRVIGEQLGLSWIFEDTRGISW